MTGTAIATSPRPGVETVELGSRVVDALAEEGDRLAVGIVRAIAVISRCELALIRAEMHAHHARRPR